MIRSKLLGIILCVVCLIVTGCSNATLSVAVAGNSVVIEYVEDGVRQLITDEDDIKCLEEVFSGDYEEDKSFNMDAGDYSFYFGNDLDTELNSPEEYMSFVVIDGKAYAIDGDEVYYSKEDIDLSILDKYRKENIDKN